MLLINFKTTSVFGIVGSFLLIFGSLITALAFEGQSKEPYSFLNHFISGLGENGVSKLAKLFNTSIIIGGVHITIFLLGVALYIGDIVGYVLGITGLIAGISGILVGFYPVNHTKSHFFVAAICFNAGILFSTLLSLHILFTSQGDFPRWIAIPGLLVSILSSVFLSLPQSSSLQSHSFRIPKFNRPRIWILAVLEWCILVMMIIFILSISIFLY
ncbi:MAG: DUF998 domain-containing protein [Anaerolineales bacterium]|nr:DUF998 domain-containing protein [Anaerolineales bacterium]